MGVKDAEPAEVSLRVGQSLVLVAGAILVASLTVVPAEGLARALGAATDSAELAVAQTVGQFLGFLLAGVVFLRFTDDYDIISLRRPTPVELGLIAAGIGALLAIQYGLLAALAAVGIQVGENSAITTGRNTPAYFLYMLPVSVLLVGPAEEFLFRGIVQGELKRAIGPTGAIVAAGAVFGLIHFTVAGSPLEKFAYVAVAAALGITLGYLYEYTGNLVVPALAHGCYNAILFLVQYLSAAGAL